MINSPIWQDIYYTYSGISDSVIYDITDINGAVLFTGKAYKAPNASTIPININRVCENYLSNELDTTLFEVGSATTRAVSNLEACKQFVLYIDDASAETYQFLYDWSYEDWSGENRNLTTPITGKLVEGAIGLHSYVSTGLDGTTKRVNNQSFGASWEHTGDYGYTKTNGNCNYAIYYLQKNGGWATFVPDGKVTKKDKYDRYYTIRSIPNTSLEFGKRAYHTIISTEFEIVTGWLSDSQADNFVENLLSTPLAYIHNISEGTIEPILCMENEGTYHTHRNNGNHLIEYKFTVQTSNNKRQL